MVASLRWIGSSCMDRRCSYPHHNEPQQISKTYLEIVLHLEIHTSHAEPIGEFIREGTHKPFRALACPIGPSCRLRHSKESTKKDWSEAITTSVTDIKAFPNSCIPLSDKQTSCRHIYTSQTVFNSAEIIVLQSHFHQRHSDHPWKSLLE